ncbi:MAG: M28 family peptidase [Promethearchaeota archaeon]|nr:MAG: M28 family peptidase [Candidatus Lokiarchaeota archaeon]
MIDELNIKKNLELFSFPRLSGTKHEKKAFDLAYNKILELGLKPQKQEFEFSTFYSRTYPKIGFFLGFLLLITFYIDTNLGVLISILTCPILVLIFIIMRNPENVKFYKKLESANLFVKLKGRRSRFKKINKSKEQIIFSCHLDSKGQKLSILARVRSMRAWFFSALIIIFIILLKYLILPNLATLFTILGIFPLTINIVAMVLILINTTNNSSLGAIDNASGIVCVLELMRYYANENSRLENVDSWFVFTGCEETGTMGIRNLYKKFKVFDRNNLMLVNFDSIGRGITLFDTIFKPEGYNEFYNDFLNNNIGLEITEKSKKINFGTHSDGTYIKKKMYQGIEFGDLNVYQYMHSKEDTIGKVNTNNLKKLCELIIENVEKYYKNK